MPTAAKIAATVALLAGASPAAAADYVVIRKEILVARPAEAVWRRIGDFCAIGEWMQRKCDYLSGSGDVGTIRVLDGATQEPMIARTGHSYTYGQIRGGMSGFAYNGTLAVEAAGPRRSTIVYTLIYDAALMPSDEARKAQFDRIGPRFQTAIETMKRLAEAGK